MFDWLYWLAVAALFALLAYLESAWKAAERGRQTGEEGGKRDEEDAEAAQARRTEALLAPVARSRSDLLAEARRNYNEGRYNEAIIYLFSHELVEVDNTAVVRMMKGKTNREYLAESSRGSPCAVCWSKRWWPSRTCSSETMRSTARGSSPAGRGSMNLTPWRPRERHEQPTSRDYQCTVRSPAFRRFFARIPAKAGTTNFGRSFPRVMNDPHWSVCC